MFRQLMKQFDINSIYELDQLAPSVLKSEFQRLKLASLGLDSDSAHQLAAYKQQCEEIAKVAYHWPSAGLVAVMHMHVVLAFARYPELVAFNHELLRKVKTEQYLLASLSAEGTVNKSKGFSPLLHKRVSEFRFQVDGIKKPASLSHIADYFACVSRDEDSMASAMVLIPRTDAVSVNKGLWDVSVLNASDTQEVKFNRIELPADHVATEGAEIEPVMSLAMGAFQFMTIQCYLGVAQRLIDKIVATFKPYYELRAAMARIQMFKSTMCNVLAEQSFMTDTDPKAREFVQSCRYSLERDLASLVSNIYKHMSANALVMDKDFMHLMNTVMMLSFHPMSEKSFIRQFMPTFND